MGFKYKVPSSKLAFTLAEVLIVLGIIGIIADMTIPNLKRDIDKTVQITQLKKFYSSFQQGMQMLMVTEGVYEIGSTTLFNGAAMNNAARLTEIDNAIKKTFNTIKTCKLTADCQISGYKYLDKSENFNMFKADTYNFYTADGTAIQLSLFSTCDLANDVEICGHIHVDTNGVKKPNIMGRDVFAFELSGDGTIFPLGSQKYSLYQAGDESHYWKNKNTLCGKDGVAKISSGVTGDGCVARIMDNGWIMDY